MNIKIHPRHHLSVGAVILCCFSIAAVVLANQQDTEFVRIGKVFHLVSVISACGILISMERKAAVFVGICLGGYLIGLLGYRQPYYISLCLIFLSAGVAIGCFARQSVRRTVLAISILSGVVMFLQVAGVGAWTQTLTTHGYINESYSVPKSPLPSLFLGYYDVQVNYLQGRPAGLLHSNQFASLVTLFLGALLINKEAPKSFLLALAFSAVAVLTLAKVVFLGVALLICFNLIKGCRRVALLYAVSMAAATLAYAAVFPGVFQMYFFSCHNIWQSIAVRTADLAQSALGATEQEIMSYMEKANFCSADDGILREGILAEIASNDPRNGSSVSAFSALVPFAPVLYALAFGGVLLALLNRRVAGFFRYIRSQLSDFQIAVAIALGAFCLAANFLDSPVFWLMAGSALPGHLVFANGIDVRRS